MNGHPEGADGNRRVGHIECRPVKGSDVEIKEIDHFSESDAIDEISHGPSNDERQPQDHSDFGWF